MVPEIEKQIRKFYQNILLQSNFQYIQYLKKPPKKLCKDIHRLDEAYTYYCLAEGAFRIQEIKDFIQKIKGFVC